MLSTSQNSKPSRRTSLLRTLRYSPSHTHISRRSALRTTQFLPSRSRRTTSFPTPRSISCSYFLSKTKLVEFCLSQTEQWTCSAWVILSSSHLSHAFNSISVPLALRMIFRFNRKAPRPTPQSRMYTHRLLIRSSSLKLFPFRCYGRCPHSSLLPKVEGEYSPSLMSMLLGPFLRVIRVTCVRGSRAREGRL